MPNIDRLNEVFEISGTKVTDIEYALLREAPAEPNSNVYSLALESACADGRINNWKTKMIAQGTQQIYDLLKAASASLIHSNPGIARVKLTDNAASIDQYQKDAGRIFGKNHLSKIDFSASVDNVVKAIQHRSGSISSVRKYASAVRYVAVTELTRLLNLAKLAQRNRDWASVEFIVNQPSFSSLTKLCTMSATDYAEGWTSNPKSQTRHKSIVGLPKNWRDIMAANSNGKYHIHMLVNMLTGCRPAELVKGIEINKHENQLRVKIQGSKVRMGEDVREVSGQSERSFLVAPNNISNLLMISLLEIPLFADTGSILIVAPDRKALSSYMSAIGMTLWPSRKQNKRITAYSSRHALAADIKLKIAEEGLDPVTVSEVLGHCVNHTASRYGKYGQGSGGLIPSDIKVTTPVKQKTVVKDKRKFKEFTASRRKNSARPRPN